MHSALRQLAYMSGLAVVYAALAWISVRVGGMHDGIAGLWAPDIVLFAVLMRNPGLRSVAGGIGIGLASFGTRMSLGSGTAEALMFGAFAPIYIASLLFVIDKFANENLPAFDYLGRVVAAIMATTLVMFLALGFVTAFIFGSDPLVTATALTLANLLAGVLFLPFVLNVTARQFRRILAGLEGMRLLLWVVACLAIVVVAQTYVALPFAFSLLPMMVAAVYLTPLAMSLVCMTSGLAGVLIGAGGQSAVLSSADGLLVSTYQFAICVNVMMPYFVCVLIAQISSARRRFAESEERFRRAVDEAPVAIVTVALDGRILGCNPAFATMLGYQRREIEGRLIQDFTFEDDRAASADRRHRANLGEFDSIQFQKRQICRDGAMVWVEVSASFIRDSRSGETVMISQVQDINARKQAERELAEMKYRWDFALASTGQAFWDHKVELGTTNHSTSWTSMFGYDPSEIDGNDALWSSLIHPDDRDLVERTSVEHQAGRIPFFELEYRMRHKLGHWIWVLDRGKVVERDSDGAVTRMIGTLTDISQRKQIEDDLAVAARLLAHEKERLRVTLESIGDAVICTDAKGAISFMNPEAERLTGTEPGEGVGQQLEQVYALEADAASSNIVSENQGWSGRVMERRDGVRLAVREVVTPILSGNGAPDGSVIVFQDFTEMRRMQRELQHAAMHDPLTGLSNRAHFRDAMEELRRRSMIDGSEHQVICIDLDRFKYVNDTAGHAAGDAMLKMVARAIRDTVRSSDTVARVGGDEFAVVLASCPKAYARLSAHAIVERVSALELDWLKHRFKVGASAGSATLDAASATIDEVIAKADAACYAAKASGGGTVGIRPQIRSSSKRDATYP